jgi:hypothetical protein
MLPLTTGQYVLGGAGQWNTAILTVLVRWRPIALGPNATRCGAGTNGVASPGWLLLNESYGGQPGAAQGRQVGWAGNNYSSNSTQNLDLRTSDTTDRMVSDVFRCEAGVALHHYRDKWEYGRGGAIAIASFATTNALGINTRSTAAGTLQYGTMGIVEIQATTVALSDAEIEELCESPVGTPIAAGGVVRWLVASDLGDAGDVAPANWVDRIGAVSYPITGGPIVLGEAPYPRKNGLPCFELFADSIGAGRNASGLLGAGWRRTALKTVSEVRSISHTGQNSFTDPTTPLDFDARHTAVGGQALGVVVGATPARLPLLQTTDFSNQYSTAATGMVGLAYGANDLPQRINVLGQSVAGAVAAFLSDVESAIIAIRAARTGPILIQNILRQATGVSTANVRTAIDLVNAQLPAMVVTWDGVYGDVHLVDACSVATPSQAAADNTAVLYDGTHPTPATYILIGEAWADVELALAA